MKNTQTQYTITVQYNNSSSQNTQTQLHYYSTIQ